MMPDHSRLFGRKLDPFLNQIRTCSIQNPIWGGCWSLEVPKSTTTASSSQTSRSGAWTFGGASQPRNTFNGWIWEAVSTTNDLVMLLYTRWVWLCLYQRAKYGFFEILDTSTILTITVLHRAQIGASVSQRRLTITSISWCRFYLLSESQRIHVYDSFWTESGWKRKKDGLELGRWHLGEMVITVIRNGETNNHKQDEVLQLLLSLLQV